VFIAQGQRGGYRVGGASRSSDEVPVMGMEQRAGSLNERKRETMTELSHVRMTGTTKLNRIEMRARAQPDTVFNNIGHVITEELLTQAYRQLDGKKAVGIDKIDKETYGKALNENTRILIKKIRRRQYKHQASRIVEIPKEDGSTRPLAISCFEDKMVEWAVSKILEKIYEPVFHPCSYGFRPNRNCHGALKAVSRHTYRFADGAIIEIDIRKCFNMISHEHLMSFLKQKITDSRFLWLIEALITAPIMEDGKAVPSKRGCPQGSIASPILSNIFLHHVIDDWFNTTRQTHLKGRAELVRYADDMVFIFENPEDAKRIFAVLGKRLSKYGLELHEGKSSMIPSGCKAALRAAAVGERIPTYAFLGFTCYWGKSRKGHWRPKYTSRRDRFTATLKELRAFLWANRNTPDTDELLRSVTRRAKGWVNYHAISDNSRRVGSFLLCVKKLVFKWINRRGGKRRTNWVKLVLRLNRVGFPKSFKTTSMFG
jgi:RNA-directed DNA polymerase